MSVTEEHLAGLRARIQQATSAQVRAQVEHDNAVKARDDALAALKAYGVSTSAEAVALQSQLEQQLADEVAAVEAALKEAGA